MPPSPAKQEKGNAAAECFSPSPARGRGVGVREVLLPGARWRERPRPCDPQRAMPVPSDPPRPPDRPTGLQPPATHVVAGVITDARGRVLLARRAEGSELAGLWEFPGGKVEPGESPEAALARELDEELGIEVDVGAALIA